MKTVRYLALILGFSAACLAQAQVGVSVSVGQPGFYGRIDIGDYPRPQLIYAEPVVVERVTVVHEPVYLHVPPGQEKKWKNYCGQYQACGRPVYFVRDNWYNDTYVPEYRSRHGKDKDKGHSHGNGNGHGKGKGGGHGKHDD